MNLSEQLESYVPFDNEERQNARSFGQLYKAYGENCYYRDCLPAHFCASTWVVNKNKDKVLLLYHSILKKYSILGGHTDGDRDLLRVALKEFEEESGLKDIKILNEGRFFDLNILLYPSHEKNGNYVPSHLHYDFTYLIEANEDEIIAPHEGESKILKWIPSNKVLSFISDKMDKELFARLMKKVEKIK